MSVFLTLYFNMNKYSFGLACSGVYLHKFINILWGFRFIVREKVGQFFVEISKAFFHIENVVRIFEKEPEEIVENTFKQPFPEGVVGVVHQVVLIYECQTKKIMEQNKTYCFLF